VPEDKIYIGSSVNMRRRCQQHFSELKKHTHKNNKLQKFVDKYGIDKIEFCAHLYLPTNNMNELLLQEEKEIERYNSYYNGLNNTNQCVDKGCGDEGRKKISGYMKKRYENPEERLKQSLRTRGVKSGAAKFTKEQILEIREVISKEGKRESNKRSKLTRILANKFNCDIRTINRIYTREVYQDIL
jgi:hypothetical protein